MNYLKQSTAVTVKIGPFVDSGDGVTPEDGLTIAQGDVMLSKNGGDLTQKGDATACTTDADGFYACPLSTVDTGTVGILKLSVQVAGAAPYFEDFTVIPASAYAALITGTGVTLADAAITKAKFDQSTAFAVESVDSGATKIARTGADADTLETLSDQNDSIQTKTDTIGSLYVTYSSPVVADDNYEIFAGDDYYDDDGRALPAAIDPYAGPSLTNAEIVFRLIEASAYAGGSTAAVLEVAADFTVVGDVVTMKAELSSSETAALLPAGTTETYRMYVCQFTATLSGGHKVLLGTGSLKVNRVIAPMPGTGA